MYEPICAVYLLHFYFFSSSIDASSYTVILCETVVFFIVDWICFEDHRLCRVRLR